MLIRARIALNGFNHLSFVFPQVFIFLILVKEIHNIFYLKIRNKSMVLEDFQKELLIVVKDQLKGQNESKMIMLETYLITFYYNYIEPQYKINDLYAKVVGENFESKK